MLIAKKVIENNMRFNLIEHWFDSYVRGFMLKNDIPAGPVKLKISHSKYVSEIICDIASSARLNSREIELARIVGLLHDVGRFEQIAKYRTFSDRKSCDHAELGVQVIVCNSALESLETNEKKAVIAAVRCHNMKNTPGGLCGLELTLTRLIRDADKIDIYRILLDYFENSGDKRDETIELELPDSPEISRAVSDELLAGNTADYRNLQTLNDFKLAQLGWIFDINYRRSYDILSERGYIGKIYSLLPRNEIVDRIYDMAINKMKHDL